MRIGKLIALATAALATMLPAAGQSLSPLDFGLREANSPMGRYFALYNTHTEAIRRGVEVSYAGIDSLSIELPPQWKSIPLGRRTDFGGLVLTVTNRASHGTLFRMAGEGQAIEVEKAAVDALDFRSVAALAQGTHLLALRDNNAWTERQGYGYKVYRSDLIVVRDGIGENAPIAPWNTEATNLSATMYTPDTTPGLVANLTMHRTKESTYKTYCIGISGQLNVSIEHVTVTTPRSRMIADGVFSISNSAHITLSNDTVHGTYSGYGSTRNYGYAFSMNNVYHATFQRVEAYGNWGVFGTNNLSTTTLEDCTVDRFDIHCYGRDAHLVRCTLQGRQTQFSSMYGTVRYDSCYFVDCVPLRTRCDFNAFTPFRIEMHGCTFRLTPRYHSLVDVTLKDTADNPRPELSEKHWPTLHVEGLTVIVPLTVGAMNIYHPRGNFSCLQRRYEAPEEVTLRDLRIVRPSGRELKLPVRLSSKAFQTKHDYPFTIEYHSDAPIL